MCPSIPFLRLYRAHRREAEPRFAACSQPAKPGERTLFEHIQPVHGPSARYRHAPVQPGSLPFGHGTRSFVERELACPSWAGIESISSLQAKGGPIISR